MHGAEFIKHLFGDVSESPVYICSLANERDDPLEPTERRVATRDGLDIERFIAKWDRKGRGLFFCVGTVNGPKRAKEFICETIGLHADIDMKDIDDSRADVERKLANLRFPPSLTIFSGNGIHAYWLFKESIPTQAEINRIEDALRLLADLVGGDISVCEVSRLMRLPGSHNTKRDGFTPVEVLTSSPHRYELDDLEEWLAETSPVILRKIRPQAVVDTNPFLEAAKTLGFKPSIDVEKRLAAMSYMAGGDAAIHQTQLAVSASLLNSGTPMEEVVDTILNATRCAAAGYGERWNWKREERAIRGMCMAWLKKHPQATPKPAPQPAAQHPAAAAPKADVVNLAEKRQATAAQKKPQPKQVVNPDKALVPAVVADGVISTIRQQGQDILLTEGEVWLYAQGIWHVATPADNQWLLTLIQSGFEALSEPCKPASLTAAYKRLTEHPGLFKRDVPWASSNVIVCQNGVLEIASRAFHPHGPQWFAKRKIGTNYEPGATCPLFEAFVTSLFADRGADAAGFVQVVQHWMGSAMAVSHLSREERKALMLVGPSRTGKTELSRIIRLQIGDPIATPSVAEISERFGLSSLYDAAAWIRDDAINEGDDLDPQRFKTIVTGEPIDIERKHRPAVPGVELQIPVLLTTNALPKARDKSDAIFNRALVLEMTNIVSEDEAHRARQRLGVPRGETLGSWLASQEGPGILNWALEGLTALLTRGSYDLPETVRNAIQRFKDDNNPVGEWARTAVRKSPHGRVSRADIMCAYHGWQREQDGDEARAFGARAFFPRLRAAAPWTGDYMDHTGRRFVAGLALTDEGLQQWDSHNQGPQLKGGSKGSSATKHDINKHVAEAATEDKNAPRF